MAIVDDKGRLGGRINLLDASIAVVVLVLIPAAFGAYLLFRTPTPKLRTITPDKVPYGPRQHIDVEGRDFRPYLRVSLNGIQAQDFLIGSTTSARVDLPVLDVGTYDVVLYDYRQEVDRLPKALTILPSAANPVLTMEVDGAFIGLTDEQVKETTVGRRFPPGVDVRAEILSVGKAASGSIRLHVGDVLLAVPVRDWEVPATLRVNCTITPNADGSLGCVAYSGDQPVVVAPNSVLTLPGSRGWVRFQISDVHLVTPPAVTEARVQFVVTERQLERMKAGDADSSAKASARLHQATIVSLGASRPVTMADAGPRAPLGGPLRLIDATLRVPVERSIGSWSYKGQAVKAGAPFTFETEAYIVSGNVVDMTPPVAPPQK
jgi:uncharacterized protein DUF4330